MYMYLVFLCLGDHLAYQAEVEKLEMMKTFRLSSAETQKILSISSVQCSYEALVRTIQSEHDVSKI